MSMTRIAYLDEFPWVRCPCGHLLNHSTDACPGCGETSTIEFRDRFGQPGTEPRFDVRGQEYQPVAYEDEYRARSFPFG